MNKKEFVDYIADNNDMKKKDAKELVDIFVDSVVNAMEEGEEINLTGFGKFSVQDVEERECRNPSNGEKVMVEAHKRPAFKFSSNIKSIIR